MYAIQARPENLLNSRAFDSAASTNGAVHLPEWTLGRRLRSSGMARIVHALFMPTAI